MREAEEQLSAWERTLEAAYQADMNELRREDRRAAAYRREKASLERRIKEAETRMYFPPTGDNRRARREGGIEAVRERERQRAQRALELLERRRQNELQREALYQRIREFLPWLFAKPEGE